MDSSREEEGAISDFATRRTMAEELEALNNKLLEGSSIIKYAHRRAWIQGNKSLFEGIFKWYSSITKDFEKILEYSQFVDETLVTTNREDAQQAHSVTTCPLDERVTILERLVEEVNQRALLADPAESTMALHEGTVVNGINLNEVLSAPIVTIPTDYCERITAFTELTPPPVVKKPKKDWPRPDMWTDFVTRKIIFCLCCHQRKRARVKNLCCTCETIWYKHRFENSDHNENCAGLMRPQDPLCHACIINKIKDLKLKSFRRISTNCVKNISY